MIQIRRSSRMVKVLAVLIAAGLGGADAIPGGSTFAGWMGVQEAAANPDPSCPNTDCKGSGSCEYLSGFTCSLDRSSCTVVNCVSG